VYAIWVYKIFIIITAAKIHAVVSTPVLQNALNIQLFSALHYFLFLLVSTTILGVIVSTNNILHSVIFTVVANRFRLLIPAILIAMYFPCASNAGIVGSAHDFSGQGWSNGEICIACHTPHNSLSTTGAPLWNHTISTATYQVYQSVYDRPHDTIFAQGDIHDPGPESIMCLSCHDGTVAVDSFGDTMGSTYISGAKLIGTDLQNDHPVGIEWIHQVVWSNTTANCTKCHIDIPIPFNKMPLPFFKGTGAARVECPTCHDPHNANSNAMMLRISNAGSGLCLHCHDQ
jgi:predicted CXXCH cytochrome family protein